MSSFFTKIYKERVVNMKKKVVVVALALMLSLNASIGLAATSSSNSKSSISTPSTTPRTGTFSTGSGSGSHATTPSQSSSDGFSGGSSSTTAPSSSTSTPPSNSSNSSSSISSSSSGFSGGASNKSTVPSTPSSSSTITKNETTYSTGNQRPSANLQNGSTINPSTGKSYYGGSTYYDTVPNGQKPSSFWPVVGAFAAGTFLGSMLHPMGGYYPATSGGFIHQPFSFMSLLLDIIVVILIIWLGSMLFRSLRGRIG